jgi:ubiquitin conjugation factor E4 A
MASNPFLALFGSSGSVETPTNLKPEPKLSNFTDMIEDIFRFTLRSESSLKDGKLFYLSDLASALQPQNWFDQPTFEQALFDYCMLLEDNSVLSYLFQCYERSKNDTFKTTDNMQTISRAIFRNFQLSLLQSELFPHQDVPDQLLKLLSEEAGNDSIQPFLNELIRNCQENEDHPDTLFLPTLEKLKEKFQKQHLLLVDYSCLEAVQVLSSNPYTAKLLVSSSILPGNTLGRECEKTILGSILSISCIPSSPVGPFDFFDRPSQTPQSVHASTEGNCWTALEKLLSKMHKIIYSLLKVSPEVNGLTRQWMGKYQQQFGPSIK